MAICPCRGMDGGMYAVHVIFFTLTLFVVSYARPPLAVHFPYHLKAKQKYCAAQLTVVDCAKPPNFPTSEIYPVCWLGWATPTVVQCKGLVESFTKYEIPRISFIWDTTA